MPTSPWRGRRTTRIRSFLRPRHRSEIRADPFMAVTARRSGQRLAACETSPRASAGDGQPARAIATASGSNAAGNLHEPLPGIGWMVGAAPKARQTSGSGAALSAWSFASARATRVTVGWPT